MKLQKVTLAIAGLVMLSLSPARADTVLDLTITEEAGSDISGNLELTLGSESGGFYPVTAASGTISGGSYSGSITGTACYLGSCSDNGGLGSVILNTSGAYPVLDGNGLGLTLADGSEIQLAQDSNPYYSVDAYSGGAAEADIFGQPFTLTLADVAATPLPATLPLFAGGLGMVGFLARRKKREAEKQLAVA